MHPEFDSLSTTTGIEILDPIESRRFALRTSTAVDPTPIATDEFAFPVDSACEIRTDGFRLAHTVPVDVRAGDGEHYCSLSPPTCREFSDGAYLLDLHAPMKLYVRVRSSVSVEATTDTVAFDFDHETTIRVGARSYHSSPAGTITVPDDPEAVTKAVSAFSSSLKTTSPERSWPTLRGHPPRVERGGELSIPTGMESPDTGIAIEVPPEYGAIYGVAPLAYYLGADVVPGSSATLRTDDGVDRLLGEDETDVAKTAGDLLKRVLLLDCVTRTEGYYPVELNEREILEPQVDLDFAELYAASPTDRLAAYLSVSDEAIDSITPTWHRVTHVQPTHSSVELLPHVVKDLSLVRVEASSDDAWTASEPRQKTEDAIESFVRRTAPADDFVRSVGTRSRAHDDTEIGDAERGVPGAGEYVPLPDDDALEQAYVGDRTPESGAKLLAEAFENDAPEQTDGVIGITVVCNDETMREEWDAVSNVYGNRDDVYVQAEFRSGVSTDELRTLLAKDTDVFHFIGHIDGLGFECPDGILDAETVEETGATTVLLNGCRSHDQGIELIRAGANAAVVTLGDVGNEGAVEVGETLARLLYNGFSIGSAMEIVREYTSIGQNYLILGNPSVEPAYSETGMPVVYHLDEELGSDNELLAGIITYPTNIHAIGALYEPYFPNVTGKRLAVGLCCETILKRTDFRQSLANHPQPFVANGELTWSDQWLSRSDTTDQ